MDNGFLEEAGGQFEKQYKRRVWWVEHRDQLKRIGLLCWIIFDTILIVGALWVFVDSFLLKYDQEQRAVASMALLGQSELRNFSITSSARSFIPGKPSVFPLGDSRYDLFSYLNNPNEDWYANFSYHFVVGGEDTDTRNGFILPLEEKPISLLAYETEKRPTSVEVVIDAIEWQRVNSHEIPDYLLWSSERLGFEISDTSVTRDLQLDNKKVGRISFTVKNNSAYSYWQPIFHIILTRGNTSVGITTVSLSQFEAGETREVDVNWFDNLPAVSKVEVIPEVNIFDPEVFMSLAGENQEDVRTR